MKLAIITNPAFICQALPLSVFLSEANQVNLYIIVKQAYVRESFFEKDFTDYAPGLHSINHLLQPLIEKINPDGKSMINILAVVFKSENLLKGNFLRTSNALLAKLIEENYELIHFEGIIPRTLPILPFLGRYPITVSEHDIISRKNEFTIKRSFLRVAYLLRANAIFVRSQSMYKKAPLIWKKKSYIVELGLNPTASFHKGSLEPQNIVLLFGRLSPYKGIDMLLSAAPIIAEAVPGVTFMIAGQPYNGYKLPDLPALPNQGRRQINLNYITIEEMDHIFNCAGVTVLPYISATQSAVITTSYGFGVPVVATDVGGLKEQVEENLTGLLVPVGDIDAFAKNVIKSLNPEWQRNARAYIRNTYEFRSKWVRITEKFSSVFKAWFYKDY